MNIQSKIKTYSFDISQTIFSGKNSVFTRNLSGNPYYFIDQTVFTLYKDQILTCVGDKFYLVIEANERNKEYVQIAAYYKMLVDNGITRKDTIVTIGGGILQDISGFIASTLFRGIHWCFIPTTLLAQADSCIGSKTSINLGNSKNLIGSFYPPDQIFIDPTFCSTLPHSYFNSGVGEIIKFHLLSDLSGYSRLLNFLYAPDLRDQGLLEEIIMSTLLIKKSYFEEDEFDTGRRNLLNYGHCFGHALESASNFDVCHGEAVCIGMGFSNLLSYKRSLMPAKTYHEFEEILRRHYPSFDISKISIDTLIHYLKQDKKRSGKHLTMILSKGIGNHYKFDDITESEIQNTFSDFLAGFPYVDA